MNDNNAGKLFGERLKILREGQGLNQEDVGEWFKMQKSTVSQWEAGRLPHATIIMELARRFGVSTDYILGVIHADQQGASPRTKQLIEEVGVKRLEMIKGIPDEQLELLVEIIERAKKEKAGN